MKNFILIPLITLLCLSANAEEKYIFKFDKSDYTFTQKDGMLFITTTKPDFYYSDNPDSPAFPYSPFCILRPADSSSKNFKVDMQKELIYQDIDIEATPQVLTASASNGEYKPRTASQSVDIPVIFGGDQQLDIYHYAYFKIAPFVYNANTKNLYFISELTVTILNDAARRTVSRTSEHETLPVDIEEMKQMVVNPDDLYAFYPQKQSDSPKSMRSSSNEHVDYLIITSPGYIDDFKKIVRKKIRKGLRTKIVDVESIRNEYGRTMPVPLAIKNKIYSYYNKGLKYVLLGGDASIVPSLMCRIKDHDDNYITTPTDLFYACFGGAFDWDDNGNGVYGELTDDVSLYPNVYVSRLPVSHSDSISAYMTNYYAKLEKYERPTVSNYSNILLAARDNETTPSGNSKFAIASNTMMNTYIKPYNSWMWLTHKYMYDNSSNLSPYSQLTPDNLLGAINNANLHFISEFTHGTPMSWGISDTSPAYYDLNYVYNQTNEDPFIVTTGACRTNAFDEPYFFSRAMLCSPHGGVAYWGSSREGWVRNNGAIDFSMKYIGLFYQKLFTAQPQNAPTRFAAVVSEAKKALISEANSSDSYYRWLMFSMNAMGDPELQIRTAMTNYFLNPPTISAEGTSVTVNTNGVDSCTIALTSIDDGQTYFAVAHNTSSHTFTGVNTPFVVTITKDNYAPFESDTLYTLNPIVGKTMVCGTENYTVNQSVPTGCNLSWQLSNTPSDVHISYDDGDCTLYNDFLTPMQGELTATLTKGNYTCIQRKAVITYDTLSVSCSQAAGSYGGTNYSARSNIAYDPAKGFVVNPNCQITLFSPNFRYMPVSYTGANPTSFTFNGTNTATFTLPYNSEEYVFHYIGQGESDCNDYDIKLTVTPNPIDEEDPEPEPDLTGLELGMRVSTSSSSLDVTVGYYDPDNNPSTIIYPHSNWNLWVYKADSGITIFNGNVSGTKTFNTSGWQSGVYVIRGIAEGQTFVQTRMF